MHPPWIPGLEDISMYKTRRSLEVHKLLFVGWPHLCLLCGCIFILFSYSCTFIIVFLCFLWLFFNQETYRGASSDSSDDGDWTDTPRKRKRSDKEEKQQKDKTDASITKTHGKRTSGGTSTSAAAKAIGGKHQSNSGSLGEAAKKVVNTIDRKLNCLFPCGVFVIATA